MIVYLKTDEEIEGFKKAGRIAAQIMTKIIKAVRPGITTNSIDNLVIQECKIHNAKPAFLGYQDYPAAICASVNEVLVHGLPNDNPINIGDTISIDIGVDVDGFIGDTAVTIVLEEPKAAKAAFNCKKALYEAISIAKSGNKLSDIANTVSKIAKKEKLSIPYLYGGHGIDRWKLHSDPFVANSLKDLDEDILLRPGMVLAIEPMFIIGDPITRVLDDNWTVVANGIAIHQEHTILVTENEPIILTERE